MIHLSSRSLNGERTRLDRTHSRTANRRAATPNTTVIRETVGNAHDNITGSCNVIDVAVSDTLNGIVQARIGHEPTIVGDSAIEVTIGTTAILEGTSLRTVEAIDDVMMTVVGAIATKAFRAEIVRIREIVLGGEETDPVHAMIGATLRIRTLATSISSTRRTQFLSFWSFTSTRKLTDTRFGASLTQAAQPQT